MRGRSCAPRAARSRCSASSRGVDHHSAVSVRGNDVGPAAAGGDDVGPAAAGDDVGPRAAADDVGQGAAGDNVAQGAAGSPSESLRSHADILANLPGPGNRAFKTDKQMRATTCEFPLNIFERAEGSGGRGTPNSKTECGPRTLTPECCTTQDTKSNALIDSTLR